MMTPEAKEAKLKELANDIYGGIPNDFNKKMEAIRRNPRKYIRFGEFAKGILENDIMQEIRDEQKEAALEEIMMTEIHQTEEREKCYLFLRAMIALDQTLFEYYRLGRLAQVELIKVQKL